MEVHLAVAVGAEQVDGGVEDQQRLPLGATASRVIAGDTIDVPPPVFGLVEAGCIKDDLLLFGGHRLRRGPPSFEQLVA